MARVAVTPGNRRVLRGALVFVDDGEHAAQWIGAWLPWQPRVAPPAPDAFRLPAGARLTLELHYRGDREDVEDTPSLDLYFADEDSIRLTSSAATVGESIASTTSPARLAAATKVWAIVPAADGTTKSLELTARRPNGVVDTLLWIPEFRHDWPHALVLEDPLTLPAGTVLSLAVEPRTASATTRLSVLRGAAAAGASPSRTRTPAPLRR